MIVILTKDQFIKRMSLIQNFQSEQETLSALLNKITDGYNVVTIGDYLVDELLCIIEDDLGMDKDDDFIRWWLYEDVDKVIYHGDEEISVRTLGELYDYIVNEG